MNKSTIACVIAGLTAAAITPAPALGWGCSRSFSGSGRYGGSFSHTGSTSGGWGGFSHSGSTSYTGPGGNTYSGSHSGSGSYGWGGATYHSSGSYSGYHGSASYSATYHGGYGGTYYGYHGYAYPAPYCGSSGSAFAAGLVTGAVTGAAVGAAVASQPSTVYVAPTPGVYVQPAPVVVSNPVVVSSPAVVSTTQVVLPVGSRVTALPVGFQSMNVNGVQYYQSGSTWYQMEVGNNGVYYEVVPAP